MKKLIVLIAVIIVVLAVLGIGLGFGSGKGEGDGSADGQTPASAQSQTADDQDTAGRTVVAVSVIDSEYSYDNKRIELDDLMAVLAEMEPGFLVEITDDNASLQAYTALTDRLDSLGISYAE